MNSSSFDDSVRRHFVALTGSYVEVDGAGNHVGKVRHFAYSGFIVAIRGVWCLMTAGHVIEGINVAIKHPKMKLLQCGLMDYFGLGAKVKNPTPISYEFEHVIHIDRHGMDMGMIPLRPLYQSSLEANGVIPIPSAGWSGYSMPKCEQFVLLGLPEENIEPVEGTEHHSSGLKVHLVYVTLKAEPTPSIDPESKMPRFAARLDEGGELKSVVGMSGGPIIGVRRRPDEGWEYACVAIQGSWKEGERMVFGTPMGIIVETTERLLDQNKS
jgi:hypothetical protein